jgi:hypothetical protein
MHKNSHRKTSNIMIEEITPAEGNQVAAYGQPEGHGSTEVVG